MAKSSESIIPEGITMFNFGGLGNMASLLANAKEVPGKIKLLTEQMKRERIEADGGEGRVKVIIDGVGQMHSITIDATARNHDDLEKWITQAMNLAGDRAKQKYADAAAKMAKDMNLNIPGLESTIANLIGAPKSDTRA